MPEPVTPEALAAKLPKFLGHPDDLCDQWLDESYELDEGDPAWDREDMQSAYREGRDEARRQLAPAWAALTAELEAERRAHQRQNQFTHQAREERDGHHAELCEIHDTLVAAYGRDDLSGDTPTVVGALVAEWSRYRAALAAIAGDPLDGVTGSHSLMPVVARLQRVAREALEGGHG